MDMINDHEAFDLFFKNSNDLMLVLDSDCHILKINPTCVKIFGYQPEELIGRHIMELVHTDDKERGEQQIKEIYKTEGVNFPFKNKALHKDGSTRWLSWSSCVLGGILYATGTDVTRQEESLRNIEYIRRRYMKRSDSGIGLWEVNLETREFSGDEHVYEIFGLPYQSSQTLRTLEFVLTPEGREVVVSHLNKVICSNIFENFDCEIIRQTDKQKRTISVTGNFIFDKDFSVKSFFGTMQDITEQTEIKRQYDELSKLQHTILDAIDCGVLLVNKGRIQWFNKKEAFGYTEDDMREQRYEFVDVFKDPAMVAKLRGDGYNLMRIGVTYSTEFEVYKKDRTLAWVHVTGKMLSDESVVWTITDITAQKQASLSIAKSHALLKDTQRAAHIGSWETIGNGKSIKLDDVACRIFDIKRSNHTMTVSSLMRLLDQKGRDSLRASVKSNIIKDDTFINFNCHITTQAGNTRHIFVTGDNLNWGTESGRIVGIVQDVTRMEQLEQELEEKRTRIDAIYATSPTAIGLIHGYDIFDCNKEFYRITGYQADELKDKGLLRLMSPSEIDRLNRKGLQSNDNVTVHSFETVFLRKTGRKVNVLLNFSIFGQTDGSPRSSIISVTDITALKIAQQTNFQLIESINQSQNEFIIYDSNWIAVYANDKVFMAHNYESKDIIGQRIREFDLDNKQQNILYQKLMETGSVNGEFQVRNGNMIIWYSVRISPIYDKNKVITGYVSVKEDITTRKNIEMELMKALSKAEQSDRMKETLLQNLSHEIRTPLNAISGFAEIISESSGLPDDTLKSYTNIISNSCNQLMGIVSDMLVMSDIQLGRTSVAVTRIVPDEILRRLHRIFLQQAQAKNITLEYVEPADSSVVIYTDETKLVQIVSNLLTNAIKFTDKGGVWFGYSANDKQIEFYVRDTGIGISQEDMRQIFDRFFQVTSNKASSYGTGLGLAISQSFAKMLHGELNVESELGKGTVFHLIIPIKV
ncbi:MAG: PAS domain S-box protein [Salinivirgaceae bacterium]|nr:PAS domain S-box protein [Salinivirgaceae bacterium]